MLNLSWIIRSSQKRGSAHLDEFRALPSTLAKIRCFSICPPIKIYNLRKVFFPVKIDRCRSKIEKIVLFAKCRILKQRISAELKAPCEAGRYSGRTPIIQDKFRMTGWLYLISVDFTLFHFVKLDISAVNVFIKIGNNNIRKTIA
jgi:hypothetical protein